jgi:hypothetical protein
MPTYAAKTDVSKDRSIAEIERSIVRWGGDGFMYGWSGDAAQVAFRMKGRRIQFRLALPPQSEFASTPARQVKRSQKDMLAAWDQACRQRWRALALVIKAKLEAIEAGITDFESEFLAQTLLPDGQTVAEYVGPQVDESYRTGRMPDVLPGLSLPELPKPGAD